jgi:hypothetical protein
MNDRENNIITQRAANIFARKQEWNITPYSRAGFSLPTIEYTIAYRLWQVAYLSLVNVALLCPWSAHHLLLLPELYLCKNAALLISYGGGPPAIVVLITSGPAYSCAFNLFLLYSDIFFSLTFLVFKLRLLLCFNLIGLLLPSAVTGTI